MKVAHVVTILHGAHADLIGLTENLATFDATACKPHCEPMRIVVAAVAAL